MAADAQRACSAFDGTPPGVVVLGLGNILCQDDGVGVEAVRRFGIGYQVADEVLLLDGGTLGLSLMSWLAGVPLLVIVDAVRADGPPGTLVRLEAQDVPPAVRERLSVHQVGVADLLDGLRLIDALPPRLLLLGLVPESIELGLERSPAVEAALPALVERLAAELVALGFTAARRPEVFDVAHAPLDGTGVARAGSL